MTENESTPFIEKSEPNFRKEVESGYSISDRNVFWPVEGRAATRYALHDGPSGHGGIPIAFTSSYFLIDFSEWQCESY